MKRILTLVLAVIMVVSMAAFAAHAEESFDGVLVPDGEMTLEYAKNVQITLYKGGYRMITGGAENLSFLVVPEGMQVPADLEEGVKVLQQPITRMYVASTNMVGLLDELDALDAISLVATKDTGWYLENVQAAMAEGKIQYSGSYKAPDYEMVVANDIQLHVDTTMVANTPEVGEKFDELNIPTLIETSSAESHPLARIEWVKVFGVILGKEEEAEQLFEAKKAVYEACTASESTGITAALGYITSEGKSYARNGGDYLAQMIGLTGGEYIQKDMNPEKSGNSNMTVEEWYALFKDADYLFYWNLGQKFYSIDEMTEFNPLFRDFKAVREGHVWVTAADWSQTSLTNIMEDMYTIFHSEDPDITTAHLIRIN